MASSFVARSLRSSNYRGRDSNNSPIVPSDRPTGATNYFSSTISSMKRDEEISASRKRPRQRQESLSRYNVSPKIVPSRKSRKVPMASPDLDAKTSPSNSGNFNISSKSMKDGIPTRRLSGTIPSPSRLSEATEFPSKTDNTTSSASIKIPGLGSAASRRPSRSKFDFNVTSPSKRKSFDHEESSIKTDHSKRFQNSPYLGRASRTSTARSISIQRNLSLANEGDNERNASKTRNELSPSPLVSHLGSSPITDFLGEDSAGQRSEQHAQQSDLQSPNKDSESKSQHDLELENSIPLQEEAGHKIQEDHLNSEDAFHSTSFKSTVYPSGVAVGVSLLTNPLFPSTSSPRSSMASPTSASPGNVENMTAPMTKEEAGDGHSTHKNHVLDNVEKAKARLSQLSQEIIQRNRSFGKGCLGRFRRFIFERQHKRLRNKGRAFMPLWKKSLQYIETTFGSSIMVAFAFIRWMFLLNCILAVIWLAAMIIPFMVYPPVTFNWMIFLRSLASKYTWIYLVQGEALDKTFVYYGGYTYQRWEQRKWYRTDYMYGVLILATFLLSYIGVLWRIARSIIDSGHIPMGAQLYPFSALVFASWDFHITSIEASNKLRNGIRMHLRELLWDSQRKKINNMCYMSAKRFTALFFLWPLLMGGNVYAVIQLVEKADKINALFRFQYAQALWFSVLNGLMPILVRVLVDIEEFRPALAETVVLSKLFFLRVLSLATLFYRLFLILYRTLQVRSGKVAVAACKGQGASACSEGFTCCNTVGMTAWHICSPQDVGFCLPSCTENYVGSQLLRLITITTLIRAISELAYGFGYVWTSKGKKRQLLIEDLAIDIVYLQALIWVGACFSPMAPVLGLFSNLLTWYIMKLALYKTCAPVEKAYSASSTSNITYGLLFITLVLSTVPAVMAVIQKKSGFCGPIHEQISMYTVIVRYVEKAPGALWVAVSWLTNPAVLLGAIFLLIFLVILVESRLVRTQSFLALTKYEMGAQRKEAREKIKQVRMTLMQGSMMGNFTPRKKSSYRSEGTSSSLSSGYSSPFAIRLPGQVEESKETETKLEFGSPKRKKM